MPESGCISLEKNRVYDKTTFKSIVPLCAKRKINEKKVPKRNYLEQDNY